MSLHLSYKKWLFFVLSSAYLVVFIQNVAITVVTPDVMQDLGLSSGDMGLLVPCTCMPMPLPRSFPASSPPVSARAAC